MLDEVRDYLSQELRIPDIHGERCVHAQVETAQCQACVDSCPPSAWLLTEENLGIDTQLCDGCGLCAPACPEGAIIHNHEPALQMFKERLLAFVACEKTELTGEGVVPCLHALGLIDILKLYHQGIRGFIVSAGDCQNCPRYYSNANLSARVEAVNDALERRQLPGILIKYFSAKTWQQEKSQTQVYQGQEVTRRHFFQRSFQSAARETLKVKGLIATQDKFYPPAHFLPATSLETVNWPYLPQLYPDLCNGCDACFNTCPHQALQIDVEKAQYAIIPENCTGCKICEDVCTVNAIHVQQWAMAEMTTFPLHVARCQRCGVPFHRPHSQNASLCHICQQINHQRQLFQVYKD